MLTPGKVRELSHPDWICDNAALSREAGWSPRTLLPEGLKMTLGWSGSWGGSGVRAIRRRR
jgi:hypothetical protein